LPDRFYEVYAVDDAQHWQGAVSLTCCCVRQARALSDLIDEDRRRVSVMDDQEEVAPAFASTIWSQHQLSILQTGWSVSSLSTTWST